MPVACSAPSTSEYTCGTPAIRPCSTPRLRRRTCPTGCGRWSGSPTIRFGIGDGSFVHPVVHAIILHFWLAYDHPFADGNGRTARALFYWAMLRHKYWMFEFASISSVLTNAPAQYAKSFLYTETDDNDLTYFIEHHLDVILRAIADVESYIATKIEQVRQIEERLKRSTDLNHRQLALLAHAVRHPDADYTIRSHMTSRSVAYISDLSDSLLHRRTSPRRSSRYARSKRG